MYICQTPQTPKNHPRLITMLKNASICGRLLKFFHRPSRLSKTKALVLEAEHKSQNRVGTWKCACGHHNAIYHLLEPSIHPLGLFQCRKCPLLWHPSICPSITSPTVSVRFHTVQPTAVGDARTIHAPQNCCMSYGYICLGYGCGLTWRTEINAEWFIGRKRRVLVLDGKRWKLRLVPRSSAADAGPVAVAASSVTGPDVVSSEDSQGKMGVTVGHGGHSGADR
ncbi:hypothetical protein BDW02DRAFT_614518 [Decorospora gaudefroyi]|uniref:Probable double zinc ribbon domain-containing protein n=1 Tax=Decorospora gaudefroyi TaxID=184978 RepID=A0A6A5KL19_9PLEO|nr:hypothetical protein BDW02DRAFT_614518 [Decorospora gaudefroyi]